MRLKKVPSVRMRKLTKQSPAPVQSESNATSTRKIPRSQQVQEEQALL